MTTPIGPNPSQRQSLTHPESILQFTLHHIFRHDNHNGLLLVQLLFMDFLLLSEIFPPQTGGSGRWLYELYSRMPAGTVAAVTGPHLASEAFDRQQAFRIAREEIKFTNWGIFDPRGWGGYYRAYRAVGRLLKENRPRELHCARCLPEGWVALMMQMRFGIPYVCYVHGEEMPIARASRELRWMARHVLRRCRLLIANTESTARLLTGEWSVPRSKIQVIHPGVDVSRFAPASVDADLRQRLGWQGRKVILTVGRLQKRKGHDMLICALRAIRQQIPDILYVVVGDGPERESLGRLVNDVGVSDLIQFHGEISDAEMIRRYQQCDLFVLPNREVDGDFEGFGMVLIEAQACGKPVLAGASGGTCETMDIPATGELVACEDHVPLAHAVIRLLADESRRLAMGRNARQWAVSRFAWEALSATVQKALEIGEK